LPGGGTGRRTVADDRVLERAPSNVHDGPPERAIELSVTDTERLYATAGNARPRTFSLMLANCVRPPPSACHAGPWSIRRDGVTRSPKGDFLRGVRWGGQAGPAARNISYFARNRLMFSRRRLADQAFMRGCASIWGL